MTTEAITLYARGLQGGWKRFAAAQVDDPEFSIVIGLLRNEAETHIGGHLPVRLWLPRDQVLMQRARIDGETLVARHQAAFDYIDRETAYRPDDVAVAIGPSDPSGESTLLITFAETWREARDYAARWGFQPGKVSTRHNAADFGADGPDFQLRSQPPVPSVAAKSNHAALTALALTGIAAGLALWIIQPWKTLLAPTVTVPTTTLEVAAAPPITLAPIPVPRSAVPDPAALPDTETHLDATPPAHFPRIVALLPPGTTETRPADTPSPPTFESPSAPGAPAMPSAVGPAPLPLPDVERAPLERDSVDAWTGPVPEIQPGDITSPLAEKNIYKVKKPLDQVERVSLLSNGKIPPKIPPAPVIEPPAAEPADAAEDSAGQSDSTFAPASGPVPAPRLASIDPSAVSATTVEVQGVPKVIPKPRPAHLTRSAPKIELEPSTAPAASPVEVQTAIRAETPAVAQPIDLPTKFASLSSPYPVKRPANFALPRTLPSVAKLPAITGTTNRSIREAATEQGLPLDRTALIGILNLDTGRKALLRLPDGRYQSMIVGDVLDGWRVSLIGVDAMRFSRAGEDRTLLLVNR